MGLTERSMNHWIAKGGSMHKDIKTSTVFPRGARVGRQGMGNEFGLSLSFEFLHLWFFTLLDGDEVSGLVYSNMDIIS